MEIRDFSLRLKALSEEGTFTGVASPYGDPPDLVGDIIEPGAFTQSIRQQGKGFPLLFAHRADEPLGLARVEDSKDALLVHGELVMEDPNARRVYAHMAAGSLKGVSIGFRAAAGDGKTTYRKDGARVLREIHLFEISIVAIPAAPRAQITSVKSLGDIQYLLKSLRDGDIDEDAISELQGIDHELKRLLVGRDPEEAKQQALSELKNLAGELARLAA